MLLVNSLPAYMLSMPSPVNRPRRRLPTERGGATWTRRQGELQVLETFIRLVTLIPRPIGRAIVAPLRILPGFRHAMRVMNYVREIDKLEDDSDFQAARALRQKSLN